MVMTVLGPVPADRLGFCHAHEHLFNTSGFLRGTYPDLVLDDFSKTVEELKLLKITGEACVVDAQPVGCGRAAGLLVEASRASGVHVIASTGFHKLGFYPENHWIHTLPEDRLTSLFLDEINDGIFDGVEDYSPEGRISARPGVIKAACDACGIEGRYEVLFSAAAEAARVSGLPLLVHLEMGRRGGEVLDFLAKRGVQPSSVILCHLDRTLDDPGRFGEAAQAGAFLEFDTIGRFKYHDDESEARMIAGLAQAGYERNILLGLDMTRSRMKAYGGGIGLDYLARDFLPRLKRAGLPDSAIHRFLHENPAAALSIRR